ncbi:MAG: hypothetical protein ABIQ88_13830 [Chitinophagaceae bacterium]
MMHIALFIVYFLLLCLAITRLRFFNGQIRPAYLVLLFALHAAAGCIHTWIAFHFYPNHGDIWFFFKESLALKQALLANPVQFFSGIFFNGEAFNLTDTSKPLLTVQYNVLEYTNTFLNLLSFNNLYINTLLLSFPVFAGNVALFKVFYAVYHKPLPALCTLLLPSVLFWTSVVYKDGLFYMAVGFFYYCLLLVRKLFLKKGILLVICTCIMLLSRANALITLLPALAFLLLAEKKTISRRLTFSVVIVTVMIAAIAINVFMPAGILSAVSERQKDFQSLAGGSRMYLPLLAPTAASFLTVFPVALVNGFFQPLPGSGGKIIYTAFSVELVLIWVIVLFGCWLLIRKKGAMLSNFDISCLLFTIPALLIMGYMVPFAGAIIRYRSIYLPFLLAPLLNVICNRPAAALHTVDQWLYRNIMLMETGRKML